MPCAMSDPTQPLREKQGERTALTSINLSGSSSSDGSSTTLCPCPVHCFPGTFLALDAVIVCNGARLGAFLGVMIVDLHRGEPRRQSETASSRSLGRTKPCNGSWIRSARVRWVRC